MKFIHLSDLHFHRNNNHDAKETLSRIQERCPEHKLIITGDLTDDGHEGQLETVRDCLMPFKGRVFLAPGNHDFGANGNFYSLERARLFDAYLSKPLDQGGTFAGDNEPVVNILRDDKDEIMVIGLDTNIESNNPFDFACGEVGKRQLAVLDTIFSDPENARYFKLLFFHHHPFMHNHPFMELKDARDLIRTIYRRVQIVLFGHKHEAGLWQDRLNIPYFLASGDSPRSRSAREIEIERGRVKVREIEVR